MPEEELGKFIKVPLREYWNIEDTDFTPWLSREENLKKLSDVLGIELELVETSVQIGNFEADIVAKDLNSETDVIIENQLETTDHRHLGQIITYASGIGSNIIVWICKKVTEEHRKAIDWLNEITSEEIAFFALEIELWRINNSPPAPKFNVVCSPNEWAQIVRETARTVRLTETKKLQREFWSGLKEYMEENQTFLSLRTPRPQHWYDVSIGRAGFHISLIMNTRDNHLRCDLYISHEQADKAFNLLREAKEIIEEEIGQEIDWQELSEAHACVISLTLQVDDVSNKEQWKDYFQWLKEYAEKFHQTFSNRIKQLPI